MSILTRDVILELIRSCEIEIEPYSADLVGPASIDLRLANSFRVFRNVRKTYDVSESSELEEITELVHAYQSGGFSFEVFFNLMERGGAYPAQHSMEDEKTALRNEASPGSPNPKPNPDVEGDAE